MQQLEAKSGPDLNLMMGGTWVGGAETASRNIKPDNTRSPINSKHATTVIKIYCVILKSMYVDMHM